MIGLSLAANACGLLAGLEDRSLLDETAADGDAQPADIRGRVDANDESDASSRPLSYQEVILGDRPIAYWRMGTGYGTNVPDESDHGYNLTLYGVSDAGASSVVVGDPTGATRFDGTTTYGSAREDLDFIDSAPFTLEAWTNDVGANEATRDLFFKNDYGATAGRAGIGLYVTTTEGFIFERWVRGEVRTARGGAPIGVVRHLVARYDGRTMSLFINGSEGSRTEDLRAQAAKRGPFLLGALGAPGNYTGCYQGVVDEVALYRSALTAEQIQRHYTVGTAPR